MTELFAAKYSGFIFSAYFITVVTIAVLVLWVVLTARSRRSQLEKLEADGMRRASGGKS